MASREQKSVNVYGEGAVQTVQTALDAAKEKEDVSTEGGALAKLAFTFILEDEADSGGFESETIMNGLDAAMDEPHVRTVEDALEELAAAYTGKYLE